MTPSLRHVGHSRQIPSCAVCKETEEKPGDFGGALGVTYPYKGRRLEKSSRNYKTEKRKNQNDTINRCESSVDTADERVGEL